MLRRGILFLAQKAPLPFRYVATDMDGTLLSPKHQLTGYAKDTLRLLTQQKGIPFIFATGRMNADVHIVNENLQAYFKSHSAAGKATQAPMYMVTSNGAVGRDALTNELVYQRTIDPAIAYELYHHVIPKNETRINCNCNQNDVWFCRYNWEEVLAFHQESGLTFHVVPDTPELVTPKANGSSSSSGGGSTGTTIRDGDFTGIVKLFYTCWDRPLLERLEAYLQERYKGILTINISASYCIDIQAKGVDKAHGLRSIFAHMAEKELGSSGSGAAVDPNSEAVQKRVEACMKQAIAFGDDLNDKGMLVNVGKGFVMGNANPKLKEEATQEPYKNQLEIIGNNADDSVSRKIRELFDLQEHK